MEAVVHAQTAPRVVTQPVDVAVAPGGSATFQVVASGDEPLTYRWYKDVIYELVGATNATLTLTNVQFVDAGTYQAVIENPFGVANSVEALLAVKIPPSIVRSPTDLVVTQGQAATFVVEAAGDSPLRYQWFFNETNRLNGATGPALTIASAQGADDGWYSVIVSNEVGRATTAAARLTVRQPPFFIQPPVSLVRTQGGTAEFSVVVGGDLPRTLQWWVGEAAIPDATNNVLTIEAVAPADDGDYRVIAANELGMATSAVARLTVKYAPVILVPPASQVTTQGQTVTLTAEVAGSGPMTVQWWRDGQALSGATNATLVLGDVQATEAGNYVVRAENDVGWAESGPATLQVRVPPSIVVPPVGLVLVPGGDGVLQVTAAGDEPLQFQWWFNGSNAIPGATNAVLELRAVTPSMEGTYAVSVTNGVGGVLSPAAVVRLKSLPGIAEQPVSLVVTQGQAAFFSVMPSGDGPFFFQWFFNETNELAGATNSSVIYFNTQVSRAGHYAVRVRNEVGEIFSEPAELMVWVPPSIVQNVANVTVAPGGTASFLVLAAGDAPLTYQWYFNQTNLLVGATNSSLIISNAQSFHAGRYSVVIANRAGTITSRLAELRLRFPPVITADPASLIVTQGATAVFAVGVTGDNPMVYRWFQNGSNLVTATTGPTLTLTNIQPSQAGGYSVLVSNAVGSALSGEAVLTVRAVPTFTVQPTGAVVRVGGQHLFEALAVGDDPIVYQWYFNGSAIEGATDPTLGVSNLTAAASGTYAVLASNLVGTATSRPAVLVVKRPPSIVTPPASQTVTQGFAASFQVVADGDAPLQYQWLRNQTNPVGSNSATLLIPSTVPQDAGGYSVVVSNEVGFAVSPAATLELLLRPLILRSPVSLVATQGDRVELSVEVSSDRPPSFAWRREGLAIPGANGSLLTLSNVQPASAGAYDVVVWNDYGAVTSQVAAVSVLGLDFGEALDPTFPTLLASDGARHVIRPGLFLGGGVDAEPDGQPTEDASGDDDPLVPGEPGVWPASVLRAGQPALWRIVVPSNGVLNAWVDWNRDGLWRHPDEQLFVDQSLVPGTNLISGPIPRLAQAGASIARFRLSTIGGLTPAGLAPDGEVEDVQLSILPAADLQVAQTVASARVTAGTSVTFNVGVTNAGPSQATAVGLTAPISPRATFVSAVPSVGNCALSAGVVICQLGNLASGAAVSVAITVRAGAGTNQSAVTVTANEFDPGPESNVSSVAVVGLITPPAYVNGEFSQLPELDKGPAFCDSGNCYPLSVAVSGLTSRIDKVVVTLHNVTHTWPDDLDVLLVGPAGQRVLLMSDCGLDNAITDVTLSFDDDAAASLPNSDPGISSGTYKPTNFDRLSDDFSPPAPPEPYVTNLSVFKGQSANGTWSLYVMDDSPENAGYIADGWSLALTLADPLADVSVAATGAPTSVVVGNTVVYSVAVTNAGPSESPTSLRHEMPAGFQFVSASASPGECTQANGVVTCDFGHLGLSGSATARIELAPTLGGTFTNRLTVLTTQYDPNPTNNEARVVTTVIPVADVGISRVQAPGSVLLGQVATVAVTVTNRGPNASGRVVLSNALPASLVFLSATGAVSGCLPAGGAILCDFGVLASGTSATAVLLARAGAPGSATNVATVAGPELDFVPGNNAATNVIQVMPAADLVVWPVSKNTAVVLEQLFVNEYVVSNAGPSATTLRLTNAVSPGLMMVNVSSAGANCTNAGTSASCDLGTLSPGGSTRVSVSVRGMAFGTQSSVIGVLGALADPNAANNVVTNEVVIIPGADLTLALSESVSPVWLGEVVNYQVRVTNLGPVTATSVLVTNRLPAGISFIGVASSTGSCSNQSGVVVCQIPDLERGGAVQVSINGRAMTVGPGTNVASVVAAEFDPDPANNSARLAGRVVASSGVFNANSGLAIQDIGMASPYPSTIFVTGLTASVHTLRVTLTNLTHTYPDDLDVVLVGPGGRSTYLMSDVGGEFPVNNAVVVFDDGAPALADSAPIASGPVRPTNFDLTDVFPAPAPSPAGVHATNLSVFAGTDPNGAWSLFVVDDAAKDRGSIAGWSLNFATVDPIADLRLTQTLSGNPAAVGSPIVMTWLVTNAGPATATDVRLTNQLEAALSGIGFSTSQGGCTLAGRQLACALGSIPKDGVVEVIFSGTPSVAQMATNVVAVSGRETDLRPADNRITTALDFAEAPVIVQQPVSLVVTNGTPVTLAAQVAGSSPLTFQWFRNGLPVPGANGMTLSLPAPTPLNAGAYQLRATNRVGHALSALAHLMVIGPPTVSDIAPIEINEDSATPEIPFVVYDFETPAENIEVTGVSSAPAIVPSESILLGGTGSNRTMRITPVPNAYGALTIYVNARDSDGGVTTLAVPMTVWPINDPPTVTGIEDQAVDEDEEMVLPFGAEDLETPAESLQLRIVSSDERVISPAGVVFEGTGANRLLRLRPVADASGTAVVAVVVTDWDGLASSNRFQVVVAPVNDPPTLDALPDRVVAEDGGPEAVVLRGLSSGASNEVQQLQIHATSSNPSVIGPPAVDYQSPAATGTLILTPLPDAFGTATITVTVSDGGVTNHLFTRTFTVEVTPVPDPPRVSPIGHLTTREDLPLIVPFTVGDPDGVGGVALAASSADLALVPANGLAFAGTGGNRTLAITPAPDRSGSTTIRVTVTDVDGLSETNAFTLTVMPVNDRPTLAPIADLTVPEDSGAAVVPLTGISAGAADEVEPVVLTASSSNPGLVPSPVISHVGPASTGSLTLTPAPNRTGTAVITVTVDDGQADPGPLVRRFTVTVTGTNDAPTLSGIAAQTMPEDGTNLVAVTIGDVETPADLLVLSAASSNPALIAATNITFSGSGSNRFVILAPRANQAGSAVITVRVSDGVATNQTTFDLTVTAVNDPPTLDPLPNLNLTTSPGAINIPLTGITSGASNENQSLLVSASTTNPGLFLNQPSVNYTSPNTTGTLSFRPSNNSSGAATISVTVTDGGGGNAVVVRSFVLTVRTTANSLPAISIIPPQTINEDTVGGPVAFTVQDAETAAGSLTVTALSSNPDLIPDANLVLGGSGANRTLTFTPVANRSGTAAIALTVTDGAFGSSNLTFTVTVNAVNDVPTISAIPAQTIVEDTSTGFLSFTIGDVETNAAFLSVSASSSAPQLIPNNRLELGGSGAIRSLRVTPLPDQSGSATITVRVSDGLATNSTNFTITVLATNDAPTVSTLAGVTMDEDTVSAPIPFRVFDAETAGDGLVYSVSSSRPELIDAAGVSFGGSETNRTLQLTPKPDQFGDAILTVMVSDGVASASTPFDLTVLPVNDPPLLGAMADQVVSADGRARTVAITGIRPGPANEVQTVAVSARAEPVGLLTSLHLDHVVGAEDAVLTYVPAAGAVGTATITVTANDGQTVNATTSRQFSVTLNQPPVIAYLPDVTTDEDTPVGPLVVTVSDPDGPVEGVVLSGVGADATLVPPSGVVFAGAGAARQLTVWPGTNQAGVTRVWVVATDAGGATTTNGFFLTVRPVVDPIVITSQPVDVLALVGGSPAFAVAASSALPLTYQWQFAGSDLLDATNALLQLASVVEDAGGSYRVIISSADVSVVSREARLTVVTTPPAPEISSVRLTETGVAVSFATIVGGTYTLEYKVSLADAAWRPAGAVPGTGAIQTITDSTATEASRFYRVRVE